MALVAALAACGGGAGTIDTGQISGSGASNGHGGTGGGPTFSRGDSVVDAEAASPDTAAILGSRNAGNGGGGASAGANGGANGGPAGGSAGGGERDGGVPTSSGCVPPVASNTCDPVCNTGCAPLSRCNVTDEPQTGQCIGSWISAEGALCLKTAITDPCAAHLTCVDGACRRLCYRDADCASPGSCCDQDLLLNGRASGYKLCVACTR